MKIWKKNFFYTLIIIVTTLLLTSAFFYFMVPIYYQHKQATALEHELSMVVSKVNRQPIENTIKILKNEYRNTNWVLENSQKQKLYTGDQIKVNTGLEVEDRNLSEIVLETEGSTLQATGVTKEFIDNKGTNYTLSGFTLMQPIIETSSILLELIPIIFTSTLLIGTLATFIYSRSSAKRILKISEATNQMVQKIDSQCDISGNDELSGLAKDINLLNYTRNNAINALEKEILKVEEIERSKEYFVQSAAHELKTPITIMSGLVEGMRLNVGRYQDREKYLEICQELLRTQQTLIQNILSVYQVDHVHSKKEQTTFLLKKIIEEIVEPYQIISETKKKQFILNVKEDTISADSEQIKRLLSNIITNAYQYCEDNGQIYITFIDQKLSVENSCKPLDTEVLSRIFEPFYRPDYSRNRKTGGTGLGLFIVKQILDATNYFYQFTPNKEQTGMVFVIDFKERKQRQ